MTTAIVTPLYESELSNGDRCRVQVATEKRVGEIAAMFEASLGRRGVMAAGHDPYPDPSLFGIDGIRSTINSPERQLLIAVVRDKIAGGIIVDQLHPFACEFNCMAVRKDFHGLGIGTAVVKGALALIDRSFLTINTTELVTHNLASQTAHIRQGLERFLGFGYCHYPCVFFPDRPESIFWASSFQGRFGKALPEVRSQIGFGHQATAREITKSAQSASAVLEQASPEELRVAAAVLKHRQIYLPARYLCLGVKILEQYRDILDFTINPDSRASTEASADLTVDLKPGYAHSYIDVPPGFGTNDRRSEIVKIVESIRLMKGKRFILARLSTNDPSVSATASWLLQLGFVFHSILPLYKFSPGDDFAEPAFGDLLCLQWISPETVKENPLPGTRGSVIQIYGYPANLSGAIINQIRQDLATI